MAENQSPEEIRRVAKLLDDAVESGDMEAVLSCFADECVVELPGVTLEGKSGVKKVLNLKKAMTKLIMETAQMMQTMMKRIITRQ